MLLYQRNKNCQLMRFRRSIFLITLVAVIPGSFVAQAQQAMPVSYTATVSNYKGLPVTKPDFPNGGAIIDFDTSKGTHIRATCLNTADHKTTVKDTDNVTHEFDVPGNKCSQLSEHVGEVFSVVLFTTPESLLANLNAQADRYAKEVNKLSAEARAGRQYRVKGLERKFLLRIESGLMFSFMFDDGMVHEQVQMDIIEEVIKGKR
jgi:hypothetical protein